VSRVIDRVAGKKPCQSSKLTIFFFSWQKMRKTTEFKHGTWHSPVSVNTDHFDHDDEDDYEEFIVEEYETQTINEAIGQSFCDTHNYLKFLGSCAIDALCNGSIPDRENV
jgi:hypothetical protein